ncbi:MAG: GNAT family N-acetyltransferase [Pseudomonadota bacterium]
MTEIVHGYQPGLLGWTVAEHGIFYASHWSFGPFFETKVATEMADFVRRADAPGNHIWAARDAEGFLATLTLDGGDAQDGFTHLRWFIASDRSRSKGLGRRLIETSLAQAKIDGMRGIFLTTFAGLDAARRIYESTGFALVHEQRDRTWGTEVMEQRFELVF